MIANLGVLISGRGSNLQSILDATRTGALPARVRVVISNRADALGLQRAAAAGVEARVLKHTDYPSREEYDRALVMALEACNVDLVCLAGFMRVLSPTFLAAFPHKVLNVHPSLLPAFPGVDAQARAVEHGVKVSGATVHLVTAELDNGPIVLQSPVLVLDRDTAVTLAERILAEEHRIYPEAIRIVLEGRWRIEGRTFRREDSKGEGERELSPSRSNPTNP